MNSERWLAKSIKSILGQTYHEIELVIIDNCSKDKTLEIIASFHDERIVILPQSEGNLSSGLNMGISYASGKYIARQDSDDFSSLDRFQRQIDYLERNRDIDLIGCGYWITDINGKSIRQHISPEDPDKLMKILLSHIPFGGPTILGKKEIFQKIMYDPYFDGMIAEDYDFVVRASEVGKIGSIPDSLYFYRTRNPSSMCGRVKYNYRAYNQKVIERAISRGNQRFVEKYGGA